MDADDTRARIRDLDAALLRWRALILLADLQRRAYIEQADAQEPAGEGERLYRRLAYRLAEKCNDLEARLEAAERTDQCDS